jgi:hypothetical protein
MDQSSLVTTGHRLVEALETAGMKIRAAMWVNNTETGSWKLWLVPEKSLKDKREFYRRVAEVISKDRNAYSDIDISDTEFIQDTHPAIKAMKSLFRVTGLSQIHVTRNLMNGYFLPDGIILRMDL